MIKKLFVTTALAAVAGFAAPASAALNVPVPANAFITVGNLDWAWAAPCGAVESCGDITLAYQGSHGWRLPTAEEFASHPTAAQFLFPGANVPNGGTDPVSGAASDLACASAYFSTAHTHCDYSDGANGYWYNPGLPGGQGVPETLVVRFSAVTGAVPEPASWAMLIAGFGMAGTALRRRNSGRQLASA